MPARTSIPFSIDQIKEDEWFDVVVIGAGGAGMSAALFAAIEGANALIIESTEFVGGTTAYSGGTNWVPGNHHGKNVNSTDTLEDAELYLDRVVGNRSDRAQRSALLANAARAVAHIEANSHVKYYAKKFQPDYVSEAEGSTEAGRAVDPLPFDGRKLGNLFSLVRPPISAYTVLGGMMVDFEDLPYLLRWRSSWSGFAYTMRLVLRYALDRLTHKRGTRLVMGNALIGRLLLSLRDRNVPIMLETSVNHLERRGERVDTLSISQNGKTRTIRVRGGIVLASGGFNRHLERRAHYLPGIDVAWSRGAPGNTGRMHDLAEKVGAVYGSGALTDFFWTPVSLRKQPDGRFEVYPHFSRDRTKPRMVVVSATGKRFTNEAASWHEFGRELVENKDKAGSIPSFLITDSEGLRRYGLGMVRPGGAGLRSAIADGYVVKANSLAELAMKLGLSVPRLEETISRFNTYAPTGIDLDFNRGSTSYQRAFGDSTWEGKNPNIGPIESPPYYAVRLYPGDIGAATGFVTDPNARALDSTNRPIPGLYVCGNDMQSTMGGIYAAPGVTIGPGMVFAYLAARHAANEARARQPTTGCGRSSERQSLSNL